jgi:Cu(I)/Ag(I) efflux system membrane protein CusA/SilA
VPGTLSVYAERVTGGNFLDYEIRRDEAARYGLTVGDVQDIIMTAVGGMNITQTVEGLERYPVNLRYGSELRDTPEKLRRILVPTPTGAQVPIAQLADIRIVKGPPVVKSENARNSAYVYIDITGIDVGTYVKAAQTDRPGKNGFAAGLQPGVERTVRIHGPGPKAPDGCGPHDLADHLPAALFQLQEHHRKPAGDAQRALFPDRRLLADVYAGIQHERGRGGGVHRPGRRGCRNRRGHADLSGYFLPQVQGKYGSRFNRRHLNAAIEEGAALRVRPKMMTVVATMAGLAPIMWSHGSGSQVMKRIAAPMIGGMVSATILTLVVVPVIYGLWKGWRLPED